MTIFSKINSGQVSAITEDTTPSAGDAVWNCDTGQAFAIKESIITDVGELTIFSKNNTGQAGASGESIIPDAGNAVWNCNTGQAGLAELVIQGSLNTSDRFAFDSTWNDNRP